MKYVEPIKFNSKSIVNNPTVKRKSNKLFWSLFCPVLMILIASALSNMNGTGLFNIGAPGQYTIGAFCALFAAIVLGTPWYVSLIFAMIGGALWGVLPGLFKAHFNVNEVITCIMLNWTGLFLVNLLIKNIQYVLTLKEILFL